MTTSHNDRCRLLNTQADGCMPSAFTMSHHVHILVRRGTMSFSDSRQHHAAQRNSLVIWQISNTIQTVECSPDFEADFLIVAPEFLQRFNPEMVWATKGYIFIRHNPVFQLIGDALRLIEEDFGLFEQRQAMTDSPFLHEVLGRLLQVFLYDLWLVLRTGLSQMESTDTASQLFFRFLKLAEGNALTERSVTRYAEWLCITPKYLSQVCRSVSGLAALQWITYYATFELIKRLDDADLPLADIADEMCFSSPQFFSRYVRKCLGVSPSTYRRNKGL